MRHIARDIKVLFEEIRYRARQFYRRLEASAHSESCGAIEKLDIERDQQAAQAGRRELSSFIRARLQLTPYWRRGHLVLGRAALAEDDIATAYASGHAIKALDQEPKQAGDGDELIAQSYLKRGAFQKALPLFQTLAQEYPSRWSIKEDLAACHIGLGDYEKASSLLQSIPEDKRSVPGSAALSFTRHKQSTKE